MNRVRNWWLLAGLAVFAAACSNDGQLIDASGEASGGTQAGGGALAFIFMVATIVVMVLALFMLDRIRRSRLEADDARQAQAASTGAKKTKV
ncbi:MAG: hypothetical protein ACOYN3_09190 [Acidimicrobiia bacterium]